MLYEAAYVLHLMPQYRQIKMPILESCKWHNEESKEDLLCGSYFRLAWQIIFFAAVPPPKINDLMVNIRHDESRSYNIARYYYHCCFCCFSPLSLII